MPPVSLSSASGLRPMSAFVVIGLVVITVATWIVFLSFDRAASQPRRLRTDPGLSPAYSISDAQGRSLARFVPRFDLEMSPRSMWQAHTPALMAREISVALGGWRSPEELLERFFPDANEGVIEVRTWDLSVRQANQLAAWIEEGVGQVPLEGIWIESRPHADGRSSFFRLFWQPEVLLSKRVREEHGTTSPTKWTRRLADGVSAALREPEPPSRDPEERIRRRDEVWSAMLPRACSRPLEGLPSDRILALRKIVKNVGSMYKKTDASLKNIKLQKAQEQQVAPVRKKVDTAADALGEEIDDWIMLHEKARKHATLYLEELEEMERSV